MPISAKFANYNASNFASANTAAIAMSTSPLVGQNPIVGFFNGCRTYSIKLGNGYSMYFAPLLVAIAMVIFIFIAYFPRSQ